MRRICRLRLDLGFDEVRDKLECLTLTAYFFVGAFLMAISLQCSVRLVFVCWSWPRRGC